MIDFVGIYQYVKFILLGNKMYPHTHVYDIFPMQPLSDFEKSNRKIVNSLSEGICKQYMELAWEKILQVINKCEINHV